MSPALRVAFSGRRRRLEKLPLILVSGAFVAIWPVAAQQNVFTPSVWIEEVRVGNVAYLGEGTGAFKPDWVTRLGASLGLRREGRQGQVSLQYAGYYEWYRKYSTLDHYEHTLGFDAAMPSGRRNSVGFSLAYTYGQAQGNPASVESADRYLSERVSRRLLRGSLRYDWRGAGRWSFGATGYGSQYWFSEISGVTTGGTAEDRTEYGATAAAWRAMSPRTSLGWEYGLTSYSLERSGDEQVQGLSMAFRLGVSRYGTVSFKVGYFERRVTPPEGGAGRVERGLGLQGQGGVAFTRTGRRTNLTFAADRSSSAGGSLAGTSTDTTATVMVNNIRPIRWSWSVAARYAMRQATRSDVPDVETLSAGGSAERRIGSTLAARMTAGYFRQFSDNPAFLGSAPFGTVGLVWGPNSPEFTRPGRVAM